MFTRATSWPDWLAGWLAQRRRRHQLISFRGFVRALPLRDLGSLPRANKTRRRPRGAQKRRRALRRRAAECACAPPKGPRKLARSSVVSSLRPPGRPPAWPVDRSRASRAGGRLSCRCLSSAATVWRFRARALERESERASERAKWGASEREKKCFCTSLQSGEQTSERAGGRKGKNELAGTLQFGAPECRRAARLAGHAAELANETPSDRKE